VPVGVPSDLPRRRPDVRRAERQLAAATANIGVETVKLFPRFVLLGVGGFQSLSAGNWFSGGSRCWAAGPAVAPALNLRLVPDGWKPPSTATRRVAATSLGACRCAGRHPGFSAGAKK
jgi:hypothetical protein